MGEESPGPGLLAVDPVIGPAFDMEWTCEPIRLAKSSRQPTPRPSSGAGAGPVTSGMDSRDLGGLLLRRADTRVAAHDAYQPSS